MSFPCSEPFLVFLTSPLHSRHAVLRSLSHRTISIEKRDSTHIDSTIGTLGFTLPTVCFYTCTIVRENFRTSLARFTVDIPSRAERLTKRGLWKIVRYRLISHRYIDAQTERGIRHEYLLASLLFHTKKLATLQFYVLTVKSEVLRNRTGEEDRIDKVLLSVYLSYKFSIIRNAKYTYTVYPSIGRITLRTLKELINRTTLNPPIYTTMAALSFSGSRIWSEIFFHLT